MALDLKDPVRDTYVDKEGRVRLAPGILPGRQRTLGIIEHLPGSGYAVRKDKNSGYLATGLKDKTRAVKALVKRLEA